MRQSTSQKLLSRMPNANASEIVTTSAQTEAPVHPRLDVHTDTKYTM